MLFNDNEYICNSMFIIFVIYCEYTCVYTIYIIMHITYVLYKKAYKYRLY